MLHTNMKKIIILLLFPVLCFSQTQTPNSVSLKWLTFEIDGQSNAEGAALNTTLPAIFLNGIDGVSIYNRYTNIVERLTSLNNTQSAVGGPNQLSFGCELGLGYLLKKNFFNNQVGVIKTALGGTSLYPNGSASANDWSPETNNLKQYALNNYNAAIPLMGGGTLDVYIWIQGEQDATNSLYYNVYQSRLINHITHIQATRSPKLIIIISLSDNQTGLNATGRAVIQSAQLAVAGNLYTASTNIFTNTPGGVSIANVVTIRQNENTSDGYHYNVGSNPYGNIAQYIFNVIQNYIK